jgi:hypothetical protein
MEVITAKKSYLDFLKTKQKNHIYSGFNIMESELNNYSSHFGLYEFENVELQKKFNVIEKL